MRRREFLTAMAASGLLVPARTIQADSILISSNPRISEFDLESLEGYYTPLEDFYIRNHYAIPSAAMVNTIAISGEVEKPISISSNELSRLKLQQLGAVLECSGDGTGPQALASNGLWEGWPLQDVLALARPLARGKFLYLTGADGFCRSIPLEAMGGSALLATKLNGRPLPPQHGAPWRVLLPGWYGMQSVKWLKQIELASVPLPIDHDEYAAVLKGPAGNAKRQALPMVQVKSVITYPVLGQVLHPGTVTLRGVAWSGGGKIVAVEITTDGGKSWRLAHLDSAGPYAWSIWRYTVAIRGTGIAEFACRAVDDKGSEQPATRDPNRLDPYANNTIERIQFLVQKAS
jgi:DMSO/TMAO reductase YedYZ molybdopterin-dependent catalytic subunit